MKPSVIICPSSTVLWRGVLPRVQLRGWDSGPCVWWVGNNVRRIGGNVCGVGRVGSAITRAIRIYSTLLLCVCGNGGRVHLVMLIRGGRFRLSIVDITYHIVYQLFTNRNTVKPQKTILSNIARCPQLRCYACFCLVECRRLWGETKWDMYAVNACTQWALHGQSYTTGTELTDWSRHHITVVMYTHCRLIQHTKRGGCVVWKHSQLSCFEYIIIQVTATHHHCWWVWVDRQKAFFPSLLSCSSQIEETCRGSSQCS